MRPEHRTIGELAYSLWQARGCPDGTAEQDWLDAEKQLRAAESRMAAPTASETLDSAKWKAAGTERTHSAARPRRSKSAPDKSNQDTPSLDKRSQDKRSAEPPS